MKKNKQIGYNDNQVFVWTMQKSKSSIYLSDLKLWDAFAVLEQNAKEPIHKDSIIIKSINTSIDSSLFMTCDESNLYNWKAKNLKLFIPEIEQKKFENTSNEIKNSQENRETDLSNNPEVNTSNVYPLIPFNPKEKLLYAPKITTRKMSHPTNATNPPLLNTSPRSSSNSNISVTNSNNSGTNDNASTTFPPTNSNSPSSFTTLFPIKEEENSQDTGETNNNKEESLDLSNSQKNLVTKITNLNSTFIFGKSINENDDSQNQDPSNENTN